MKGTLEFNLPEENESFLSAQRGWQYKDYIEGVMQVLRRYRKYEELTKVEEKFLAKLEKDIIDVVDWSLFE